MTVCDCHVHVLDPVRFPYAMERTYTPGVATADALRAMHDHMGVGRLVLVQPSVYGVDNACMLDALAFLGPERARGIAVVDLDRTSVDDIDSLHAAGVRGIRLNFHVRQTFDPEAARRELALAARLLRRADWHLQVYANAAAITAVANVLLTFPIPVVLDHFGGIRRPAGQGEAIDVLTQLMRFGPVHVKVTAPYFVTAGTAPQVRGLVLLAQTLCEVAPHKVVWGSDWPHTGGSERRDPRDLEPFRSVDDAAILQELASRLPAKAVEQVFERNPAELYGFP